MYTNNYVPRLEQNVINLKKENYELREQLKVHISLECNLADENNKLRYDNIELKSKLMDETNELKKDLDEVKRERDKLKRDIEIQKLGGLKLCYKD